MLKSPLFLYLLITLFYVAVMVGGVTFLQNEGFNKMSPYVQVPEGK